jgi:hypothetical protein
MRSKARAIAGNNTARHEYEFMHKQIFKMVFFLPIDITQYKILCGGVMLVVNVRKVKT